MSRCPSVRATPRNTSAHPRNDQVEGIVVKTSPMTTSNAPTKRLAVGAGAPSLDDALAGDRGLLERRHPPRLDASSDRPTRSPLGLAPRAGHVGKPRWRRTDACRGTEGSSGIPKIGSGRVDSRAGPWQSRTLGTPARSSGFPREAPRSRRGRYRSELCEALAPLQDRRDAGVQVDDDPQLATTMALLERMEAPEAEA